MTDRLGKDKARRSGFTLIELVTAAAIFSVLGVMLFSMVRSGMDMWKDGESARNNMERGVRAIQTIARELRLTFSENDSLGDRGMVQFRSDFIDYDRDGDGNREARVQRLLFVRINMEERENERLRNSGDQCNGRLYFTLFEESEAVLNEEGTRPTGGLAEAVFMSYAPRLAKKEERDGLLHLYRGYRSPIGGEDSFFAEGNLMRTKEIETNLLPMLDGLLYLEFRFWNQNTYTFDEEISRADTPEGAGYTWDSTRGYLANDAEEGPNRFRFYAGEESLEDVTDDIFPSKVQITVVVEEPRESRLLPRLVNKIRKEDRLLPVDLTGPFRRLPKGERFVRIDEEWIAFSGVDGNELKVTQRGARHTIPSGHDAGSRVHYGNSVSSVVDIPTAKQCWNMDEDDY